LAAIETSGRPCLPDALEVVRRVNVPENAVGRNLDLDKLRLVPRHQRLGAGVAG